MEEDDKLVTCDLIINYLHDRIQRKEPIPPQLFLSAAEKLNILLSDEEAKYADLYQKVAQMKVDMLSNAQNSSVASAKLKVEATTEFKEMTLQRAKIARIQEHIRLAKIQSRMASDEIRGYN